MAAKMSANVFPRKAFRSQKPSHLGPDVPSDSGRRLAQRLTRHITGGFFFVAIFPSPLHLFLCTSGFISAWLKDSEGVGDWLSPVT